MAGPQLYSKNFDLLMPDTDNIAEGRKRRKRRHHKLHTVVPANLDEKYSSEWDATGDTSNIAEISYKKSKKTNSDCYSNESKTLRYISQHWPAEPPDFKISKEDLSKQLDVRDVNSNCYKTSLDTMSLALSHNDTYNDKKRKKRKLEKSSKASSIISMTQQKSKSHWISIYNDTDNVISSDDVKMSVPMFEFKNVMKPPERYQCIKRVSEISERCITPIDAIDVIEEIPIEKQSTSQMDESISRKVNKACVQYSRVGQQALSMLNDEVSEALRNSLSNIDDIQMRIRKTVDEINECDKLYRQLKSRNLGTTTSYSTMSFTNSELDMSIKSRLHNLEDTTGVNALLTDFDTMDAMSLSQIEKIPCDMSQQEFGQTSIVDDVTTLSNEVTSPKTTPICRTPNELFIPPEQRFLHNNSSSFTSQQNLYNIINQLKSNSIKTKAVTSKKSFKKLPYDRKSSTASSLNESNTQSQEDLCNINLNRIQATENLHNQLIKEFQEVNSFLDFQRQLEQLAKKKEKSNTVEIMAEELFIPEKQINKIAETNTSSKSKLYGNSKSKSNNFLYHEKRKVGKTPKKPKIVLNNLQEKYPNSLLFAGIKKGAKINSVLSPSSSIIRKDSNSDHCNSLHQSDSTAASKSSYFRKPMCDSIKTGLDCFDILDEITLNDLKPFEAEYPRKDHIHPVPSHTPIKKTYLYKLMYGSYQNYFEDLLKSEVPSLHCQSEDCEKCVKNQKEVKKNDKIEQKKKEKVKKSAKRPKKSLNNFNLKEGCVVSQTSSILANSHKQTRSNKNKVGFTDNKKLKKIADEEIARKLRPYIFDPRMRYPTTITVMPVIITTFTNPNFTNSKKNQSGDFLTTNNSKQCEKTLSKPVKSASKPLTLAHDKKSLNNKYTKPPSYQLAKYLKQNADVEGGTKGPHHAQSIAVSPKGQIKTNVSPEIHMKTRSYSQLQQSKTIKTTSKPNKPNINPHSMFHKHAAESCKLLKDIQMLSQKTKLETSIQNVIDMIENKIVEILSSPEQSHSEAFKTIEAKIVEILSTIQTQNSKPLEVITEASDTNKSSVNDSLTDSKNVKNQKKFVSKTTPSLKPVEKMYTRSRTDSQLIETTVKPSIQASNKITTPITDPLKPLSETAEQSHDKVIKLTEAPTYKITVQTNRKNNKPRITLNARDETKQEPPPALENVDQEETLQAKEIEDQPKAISLVFTSENSSDLRSRSSEDTTTSYETFTADNTENSKNDKIPTPVEVAPIKPEGAGDMAVQLSKIMDEKTVTSEETSDEYLTPFIEALEQYNCNEDHPNSNILEFLDTLSSTTNDDTFTCSVEPKFGIKTIYHKKIIQATYAFYESQIMHSVVTYYPVKITVTVTNLNIQLHRNFLNRIPRITGIKNAMKIYTPRYLNRLLLHENKISIQPNANVICCRIDKLIPQKVCKNLKQNVPSAKHEALKDNMKKIFNPKAKICTKAYLEVDEIEKERPADHGLLLNTIYSILFMAIFLSLTLNYTCQ